MIRKSLSKPNLININFQHPKHETSKFGWTNPLAKQYLPLLAKQ
jgi:hypothetical protein